MMDMQQRQRTFARSFPFLTLTLAMTLALAVSAGAATRTQRSRRPSSSEARVVETSRPLRRAKLEASAKKRGVGGRGAEELRSGRHRSEPSAKRVRGERAEMVETKPERRERSRRAAEREPTRVRRHRVALAQEAPKRVKVAKSAAVAAEKPLTVDDFRRAAGLSVVEKTPAPAETFATGASHPPQEDESSTAQVAMTSAAVEPDAGTAAARHAGARGQAAVGEGVRNAVGDFAAAELRPSHTQMAEAAIAPRLPGLYASDGGLIVPAPLKGSHEILVHQNMMAEAAGLNRIQNDAELDRLRARRELVSFAESVGLRVNPQLPSDRRCARPWAVSFAETMSRAYYAQFHEPLELTSAVRTVAYQRRLEHVNGNAAATAGEGASPHLTGQAMDFGKRGMSVEQVAWMRAYLLPLMQAGKVDVEEEFQQACFHISVYRSYMKAAAKTEVAALREKQGSGIRD